MVIVHSTIFAIDRKNVVYTKPGVHEGGLWTCQLLCHIIFGQPNRPRISVRQVLWLNVQTSSVLVILID